VERTNEPSLWAVAITVVLRALVLSSGSVLTALQLWVNSFNVDMLTILELFTVDIHQSCSILTISELLNVDNISVVQY